MALILRLYSYLFHLILALFLLGVAIVASDPGQNLQLGMLPWKGEELHTWLLYGSIAGVIVVLLAITRLFPYLFPVWALVVLVLMIRGYFLQPYTFSGRPEFNLSLWLTGGALLAFLASLTIFRKRKR